MGIGTRIVETVIYMVVSVVLLYLLDATVGTAMDQLRHGFSQALTYLHMSSGWMSIASTQVSNFDYFFDAFWIVGLTIIIWAGKTAFIENTYGKPPVG